MISILRRKTNTTLIKTMSSQVVELGISFLRNILLVRYIGLESFGKYQYVVALLALMDFGYASLDSVIRRFFSEQDLENKKNLLWANLIFKTVVYGLVSITVIFYLNSQQAEFIQQNRLLVYFLLVYFYISNMLNTAMAVGQSLKFYDYIVQINVIVSVAAFIVFLVPYYGHSYSTESFLLFYLLLNAGSALVRLMLLVAHCFRSRAEVFGFPNASFSIIFSQGIWQYRNYSLPLLMGNLSGYVINYVPSILLGKTENFESISYLEIIKKIFKFVHKFVPTSVKTMVPTIVSRKSSAEFALKWGRYTMAYIGLSIVLGTLLFVLSPVIMGIYKVPYSQTLKYLFAIYSLYLSFGAWSQSIEFLVFSSTSTRSLFVNSLLRQVYVVIGLACFSSAIGPIEISLIVVSSVSVSVLQMLIWVRKYERSLMPQQAYNFGLIALHMCFVFILVKFDVYISLSPQLQSLLRF